MSDSVNIKEPANAKDFVALYLNQEEGDRIITVTNAQAKLTKTQFNIFRKEIKKIEDEEKAAADIDEEDPIPGPSGLPTPPATVASGKGKDKKVTIEEPAAEKEKEVSDDELIKFWDSLEGMSGEDLLSEQVINDFQYVGFDPNSILRSIIASGTRAKKDKPAILSDISQLCTIAVIKGSVTDKNLKKMTDEGKRSYGILEATYGLKKGGSKGQDPNVVTVARVGAAFPGSIAKIIMRKPELAKKFTGPFGSKVLPSYLRHQSAAACIPEVLEMAAKDFLIGMIVAYTSDQSKVISQSKDKPIDIYETQQNFINQTHSSNYPTPEVRKSIFKSWTIIADYDKLKAVGDNIAKINTTFELISKEDLQKAINSV